MEVVEVKKMGNDLGQAIKINRLRANMTQADLANGIISVSYLSKIENGTAEPPDEIIELLGEKLKINMLHSDEHITDQTIIRWFHHLLHSKLDESIRLYNRIKDNLSSAIDKQLLSLIEIHKLCYYSLIQDLDEAEKQIASLQKSSKKFSDIEKYYFYKFIGNYHYRKLSYKKALESYLEAEKLNKAELFHKMEEIHDLYYLIANAASKSRQTHLSLLYSLRALDYYQPNYKLKKCAECQIILGISYQRLREFEKAKASYNRAIDIVEKIDNSLLLKLCYQNIGSMFSDWKQPTDAINYFLKSYELRKYDSDTMKIIPISSLMKEYYNLGDISNSKVWLDLGLDLIKSLNPLDSTYVYEFTVYKHLINGIDDTFEDLMTKEVIPFVEEKELIFEKVFYTKILAKFYKDKRKYKLSSHYYEKAYKTIAEIACLERR